VRPRLLERAGLPGDLAQGWFDDAFGFAAPRLAAAG
jgi:hypothetical protein